VGQGGGWCNTAPGGACIGGGGWAGGASTSKFIGVGLADNSADLQNKPEVAEITRPAEGREEASVAAPVSSEKGRTCHPD
jgi:hypothetical protein